MILCNIITVPETKRLAKFLPQSIDGEVLDVNKQLKHQTIVTLKAENILKVQNIWCLSVSDKYF